MCEIFLPTIDLGPIFKGQTKARMHILVLKISVYVVIIKLIFLHEWWSQLMLYISCEIFLWLMHTLVCLLKLISYFMYRLQILPSSWSRQLVYNCSLRSILQTCKRYQYFRSYHQGICKYIIKDPPLNMVCPHSKRLRLTDIRITV
jgi:hypothetical protein